MENENQVNQESSKIVKQESQEISNQESQEIPEEAAQKIKSLSQNSYIVTPQEYLRNFTIGYTEGESYIENKNGFKYLPWGYVFHFMSIYHPNLEIVNWEFEVIRKSENLSQLPVSGDETKGYGVHYYLYNRDTGLSTHPMFYPVINYKNQSAKGKDFDTSLLNKTKMRAIVKMVAKEIGLGMHLYMRLADIVEKDFEASEQKEQFEEKEKTIQNILKVQKNLNNYDEKYKQDLFNYTYEGLKNKSIADIRKIYEMQYNQGLIMAIRKSLDNYKNKKGQEHELKNKNIEKMNYQELNNSLNQLKNDLK